MVAPKPQKQKDRRAKYSVQDVEWRSYSRQLRLDVYADAFGREQKRLVLAGLNRDVPQPPSGPYDRCAWEHYERQQDQCAQYFKSVPAMARKAAEHAALYHGVPSWTTMRRLIWERDKGVCWGCGEDVPFDAMHLGHLVDRMCGGLDLPPNLAVMCGPCNIIAKDLCHTLEEAYEWRKKGGFGGLVWDALGAFVKEHGRWPQPTP